jgi:hypothetical protein
MNYKDPKMPLSLKTLLESDPEARAHYESVALVDALSGLYNQEIGRAHV